MKDKSTIISFIISFIVVGSLIAVFTWNRSGDQVVSGTSGTPAGQTAPGDADNAGDPAGVTPNVPDVVVPPVRPVESFDPAKYQASPTALMGVLVDVLKGNSDDILRTLTARKVIDETVAGQIRAMASRNNLKLKPDEPFIEVGTWDGGDMARYRIYFDDGGTGIVDLKRTADHLWIVQSVTLPEETEVGKRSNVVMNDAMGITERFMNALLKSDFETARSLVDSSCVSNATLAGLCILFEEGDYRLRQRNALKGMFMNDSNAGFLVYLDGKNGSSTNMGLTLRKTNGNWLVSEVSLDALLTSYVKEVAEGEDVYVPLVKNPKGGDSLVLFFGFNEDTLTARSLKQLEIVAGLVKLSSEKKLEISGHTDDVGGEAYNQNLSERRAAAVKAALVAYGVPEDRIETKGFGKKQPRRTYGSRDSDVQKDEARRVNRRAEMYLDF